MATTVIADYSEALTGVCTADASFLVSSQKSVVSSVPKSSSKWAGSLTDPSSHGGNSSQGTTVVIPIGTDTILSVSRNGFSAEEVPYNMKGFIANGSTTATIFALPSAYRITGGAGHAQDFPSRGSGGVVSTRMRPGTLQVFNRDGVAATFTSLANTRYFPVHPATSLNIGP